MTKKVIGFTALILSACVSVFGSQTLPFLGKITADNVNVRAGQSAAFERLYQLNKEETVVVVDHKYSRYKVKLPDNAEVYISEKFVKRRIKDIAIVTGNVVNLRAGPGEEYSALGKVKKNQIVRIRETVNNWCRIEPMEGMHGWILDKFVTFHSNDIPAPKIIKEPSRNKYKQRKQFSKTEATDVLAIQKDNDAFSVVGRLEDLGRVAPKDTRYKLVVDEKTAYYLSGSPLLLNSFVYYKVRIYGKIKEELKAEYPHPIITVSKLKLVL